MIDRRLPLEYQHETDYRKIPVEYLDSNIPQGRGIVKWQPFKTTPELYEKIKQYKEDQSKVAQPLLSDDQINILNSKISYALEYNLFVSIDYWENGYFKTLQCYIIDANQLTREILVSNEKRSDTKHLPFSCLYSIE